MGGMFLEEKKYYKQIYVDNAYSNTNGGLMNN